jgi:putative Ca2+/H+ antiporter (TMEM165/GDT1 family)
MSALLTSTLVVAVAEIGDKTQLLSLMLAARFRRPWPIILGIFVATIANHFVAAWVGDWVAGALGPQTLRWLLGVAFIAIAVWALKPDELDDAPSGRRSMGVFATALVAFFIAEIGDKTQVATIAMAAKYTELAAVVAGTTLGMMLANVPVVFFGERIVARLPLKAIRWFAAAMFAVMGVAVLLGLGS